MGAVMKGWARERTRLRGLGKFGMEAGLGCGGLVVLLIVAGSSMAAIVSWTSPYSGTTIQNAPTTWNTGTGYISWGSAPNFNIGTGVASYEVNAYSVGIGTGCPNNYPPYVSCHGSADTTAGFQQAYTCSGLCTPGVHSVYFNWTLTWNYTIWACGSSDANNQFGVFGEIYSLSNGTVSGGPVSSRLVWMTVYGPGACTPQTGGGINQVINLVVTSQFNVGGGYLFETYLFSEVYTAAAPGGSSSSELNVGIGGAEG